MKALILAAGTGNRLVNLTRDLPKALIEVRGKPLIEYALDFADSINCEKILVVGGFYFEKLQKYLKTGNRSLMLLENRDYLKGNIFSLIKALPFFDDDFLLMNVDHIFPLKLGRRFLAQREKLSSVTAFIDFDRPLHEDDMKVQIRDNQTVAKIAKTLSDFDAGYIGLTYIPQATIKEYKEAAKKVGENNENAVVEHILPYLATMGQSVEIFSATGIRWLEVDNLSDLNNAERILKWVEGYLD